MLKLFQFDWNRDRVFGLDILRCVAILFVVFGHGNELLPASLQQKLDFLVFDGVSIFFVLSGFLIGRILIKTFSRDGVSWSTIKNFWIRRWFRTLHNYFLVLSVLALIYTVLNQGKSPDFLATFYLFVQNLWYAHPGNFFPEAWSLSIEEWFYILSPLTVAGLYFGLNKDLKKAVLATVVLIILFSTVFRWIRFEGLRFEPGELEDKFYIWDELFRKQVITRLDSIMFGILGAYIAHYHPTAWVKNKKLWLVLGILGFVFQRYYAYYHAASLGKYLLVFSFSVVAISTLLTLPYLSQLKSGKGLIYRWITRISLISYSLYLLNLSFVRIRLMSFLSWDFLPLDVSYHWVLDYGFFWVVSILLSILLFKYFERPMTGLRERFSKP